MTSHPNDIRTTKIGHVEVMLAAGSNLDQDQEFFYLKERSTWRRVRFHDYAAIYAIPGLYDWLFYEILACQSHTTVATALKTEISAHNLPAPTNLRAIELGAGNGIVGSQLRTLGIAKIVGVDLLEEAAIAAYRDNPNVYTDYLVADLTKLTDSQRRRIHDCSANLLVCVAALGFDDIPAAAFVRAVELLETEAWLVFNIKDQFLAAKDSSGFSQLVYSAVEIGALQLLNSQTALHRRTASGHPLRYTWIIARKTGEWKNFANSALPRLA